MNGPTDADAGINISLSAPGTYTYDIFGEPGSSTGFDGLNLFFNDGNGTPRISVFGATQTPSTPSTFAANTSASTLALNGSSVAGAGTLSFVDNGLTITLSNFTWATPPVNNIDLVGPKTTGSSNANDFVGSFTLTVQSNATTVPEPAYVQMSILVLGTTGMGLLSRWRRRK